MDERYGLRLRQTIATRKITSFIGVYDVFSASVAAKHFDGLFIRGFGLAASDDGLPDIGFITWTDMVNYVQRIRTILPDHHLVVYIDDGYCNAEVACHVVAMLERIGASAVVLEDQKRPRRCGHFSGKQLMDLEPFLEKLEQVLATRRDLYVIARTDATDHDDRLRRVEAFAHCGADAVLCDGLDDLNRLPSIRDAARRPVMFNQIAGGKSPGATLSELATLGVSLVNYSTPCLFAAQQAMDEAMTSLRRADGKLPDATTDGVGVAACTALLKENLARRDTAFGVEPIRLSPKAAPVD